MRRIAAGFVLGALILAGCASGPSEEEKAEFGLFASERQQDYPQILPSSMPTSIREYTLGSTGITPAGYIVAGAFTGATTAPDPSAQDGAYTVTGHFKLHQSLLGSVPSAFDVDLGTARGSFLMDMAARGAGDVVLFLEFDATTGEWALIDGGWSLAQSDEGRLSMPLVPADRSAQYLAGVVDVADIHAMIIASNLDPNGSLTGGLDDLGNDGLTDTQQDLIDQATDLAD